MNGNDRCDIEISGPLSRVATISFKFKLEDQEETEFQNVENDLLSQTGSKINMTIHIHDDGEVESLVICMYDSTGAVLDTIDIMGGDSRLKKTVTVNIEA